jgi:hypothetical protein
MKPLRQAPYDFGLDDIVKYDPGFNIATVVGHATSAAWIAGHAHIFGGYDGTTQMPDIAKFTPSIGLHAGNRPALSRQRGDLPEFRGAAETGGFKRIDRFRSCSWQSWPQPSRFCASRMRGARRSSTAAS